MSREESHGFFVKSAISEKLLKIRLFFGKNPAGKSLSFSRKLWYNKV